MSQEINQGSVHRWENEDYCQFIDEAYEKATNVSQRFLITYIVVLFSPFLLFLILFLWHYVL